MNGHLGFEDTLDLILCIRVHTLLRQERDVRLVSHVAARTPTSHPRLTLHGCLAQSLSIPALDRASSGPLYLLVPVDINFVNQTRRDHCENGD
jgi:hypothetical protein